MNYRKSIGELGENLAGEILKQKGYKIAERNYMNRSGEIDIIAMREKTIHFIEVKARTNHVNGYPAEAVNKTKQKKIRSTAAYYLQKNNLNNSYISFDVFEVDINHIENCF